METRLLRVFCAVAESGNLVGAAKRVHLTSSAVSHSIKSLETELGCRLFERVGKRLALNHAGEQLLAQVKGPLAALDSAAEGVRQLGKWGKSRLRIGASQAACEHILPGVIRELKKHHASLELRVESGDTPQLIELLQQSKVDLALGLAPTNPVGLSVRQVFRDELMFVFSPAHPWADGRPITRDEVRDQPFIVYQRASLSSHMLEHYFRQQQMVPSAIMEVASTAAIVELVKLNLGHIDPGAMDGGSGLETGNTKDAPAGREGALSALDHHCVVDAPDEFGGGNLLQALPELRDWPAIGSERPATIQTDARIRKGGSRLKWSERQDLNLRRLGPKASALPG